MRVCAFFILVLMALHAEPTCAEGDVLTRLVPPKIGSGACYKGEYDKAYVAEHPKQTSRKVLLSLQYEISGTGNGGRFARIAIERSREPEKLFLVGRCSFSDRANVDADGKRLFSSAHDSAGIGCELFVGPGSDEKRGDILVQIPPDMRTAILYLPGEVPAWRAPDQAREAVPVALGAEDRVLRLRSVYPEGCSPLAALRVK